MFFLIPFRTDRPKIRPAYFTIFLIVVNTAVQVVSRMLPEIPMTLHVHGEKVTTEASQLIVHYGLWGGNPTLLTFFSHQFIHGDELHLLGNMLFLWIFGSLIEDTIRPWGLAALYLLGGLMAALAHIGISSAFGNDVNVPMVGASGAVAAIMGLFMLRFFKTRVEIAYFIWVFWRPLWGAFWVQSVFALLYWIVLEIGSGVLSAVLMGGGGGVAHWAHVGGFFAGMAFAPFLGSLSEAKKEYISDDPEMNVEYLKRNEQVQAAEKSLKADPGNAYQMRRLAQALQHAGEYEQATEMFLNTVQRFATRNMITQASDVFAELMAHNDTAVVPPDTLQRLGQHYEGTNMEQAAFTYWLLASQHSGTPQGEFALLRLGIIYQQSLNRPQDAARCYQEFVARYPASQWASYAQQALQSIPVHQGWTG
jgi:membrane associated rhomboid family serine protease